MFGNTMGWIIAAVIGIAGFYGEYSLLQMTQPTAVTNEPYLQAAHNPLDLADVAAAALPAMDDPKNDAGDLYRRACADYLNHKPAYTRLQESKDFDLQSIEELKGVDLICQATRCSSMHLFNDHPEEIVGFNTNVDVLDQLDEIHKAMIRAATLAKADDSPRYDLATKYANGVAAMGYRLYKERCAYTELDRGQSMLSEALATLDGIAKKEHKDSAALTALKTKLTDNMTQFIQPVHDKVCSIGDPIVARYSGDMFLLAQDPTVDRVWRVESIRRLGRLQFNAASSTDQRKAPKVLAQLATDEKDPIIRAAAAKARAMTSFDNQSQR